MASPTQEKIRPYLKDWLYQLADDKLTIGHRDSEWLGMCPDIEGDVAFSSIAQDEVGHAVFYFELLHELGENDADTLAFTRKPSCRKNAVLLERPNNDWVYSMVRHHFYDVFDHYRLHAMGGSTYAPLRFGAQKILNEEKYHLLHMTSWFTGLSSGNGQSKARTQEAVREVWADLYDLFDCGVYEHQLIKEGIIEYGSQEIKGRWIQHMKPLFEKVGLEWPGEIPLPLVQGRLGNHTEDLCALLTTMGEVYEVDRLAKW